MIMSYLPSPVDTWSTYRVQISRETENIYCAAYLCNPFSAIAKNSIGLNYWCLPKYFLLLDAVPSFISLKLILALDPLLFLSDLLWYLPGYNEKCIRSVAFCTVPGRANNRTCSANVVSTIHFAEMRTDGLKIISAGSTFWFLFCTWSCCPCFFIVFPYCQFSGNSIYVGMTVLLWSLILCFEQWSSFKINSCLLRRCVLLLRS